VPLRGTLDDLRYVNHETDHWYLPLPYPNRVYCAQLCLYRWDVSDPHVIATSKPLFVPRDCPSDSDEETWSTIEIP
jgi:hypothetical protein